MISYAAASPTKAVNGAANENEWGEFLHIPGKKFYDFNQASRLAVCSCLSRR